ncbi:glycosyltransferase family 2 protein [Algoriella sp.]|uniref:glycosyltransferase family 2 protein n=1 Tax=Algoriella sp. TaxID=1872434 RepID=UPI001B24BDD6|nr:glycosyltransferase family 2 protein [Algoriella sp.]MBO6213490.1 glycosyltransferase family 2 protein [Algoriella sp.]
MKLSIIIPVYNTEKYIKKCIDSILIQSFSDYELLLINDGSTDDSAKICDEYSKIDDRIKVLHKKNGGVSSARNLGLDNAEGKFVFFVDSDDYLLEDSLNFLKKEEDVDLYKFKISTLKEHKLTKKDISEITVKLDNELWRYIFNKEIIDSKSLRFIDIKYGEDFNFIAKYFSLSKVNKFVDTFVYVYREDTPNSAMNKTKNIQYVFDHFIMIQDIVDFFSSSPESKLYNDAIIKGFKMLLVLLAKNPMLQANKNSIMEEYIKTYSKASRLERIYRFHPFFFSLWINYYKKRFQ